MDWRLVTLCVVLAAGVCVSLWWVRGYAEDRQTTLEEYLGPEAGARRGSAPTPLSELRDWPEDTPILLAWSDPESGLELARLDGKGRLIARRRKADGTLRHRWSSILLKPRQTLAAREAWQGASSEAGASAATRPATGLVLTGYGIPSKPARRSSRQRFEAWLEPQLERMKAYSPRDLLVSIAPVTPSDEARSEEEAEAPAAKPRTWPLGLPQPQASVEGPQVLRWTGSSRSLLRIYSHVEDSALTQDEQKRLWTFTRLQLPKAAGSPSAAQAKDEKDRR